MSSLRRRTALAAGVGALGGAAVTGIGVVGTAAVLGVGGTGVNPDSQSTSASPLEHREPGHYLSFRGDRQPGIADPPPAHLNLVAFDLVPGATRDHVRRLMQIWTDDIDRLMAGQPVLSDTERELAMRPASLTATVGIGPRVFDVIGASDKRPAWLADLPPFPKIDRLEDRWNGGDVILQVCAEDPVVLSHAARALIKDARTLATVRWVQRGFREAPRPAGSMRNLMGQVDGTINPDPHAHPELVFIGGTDPVTANGSSLVVRRIRMEMETWDELDRPAKEQVIGRKLPNGAPLTGSKETDPMDFDAVDASGLTVIPDFAHARRAHAQKPKEMILRRPFNYDEPLTPELVAQGKTADSGLVFLAYQANIHTQYIPIQQRLAELDLLNQWTTPIGSAVFFIFPGAREGEFLGQALLQG
ncbi:Dyp-type peroxidase [Devriesea agamarum]|uniref:Dyp-type peroxidase n=1 Tax=Devriesea agamarum TaxID=472569 RepID=UPI000A01BB18|nr:Dyp-type peroxidase [Devriesea agamarum]